MKGSRPRKAVTSVFKRGAWSDRIRLLSKLHGPANHRDE